ncbi:MAG TPA: hypothetical protein VK536_04370 [Candidatus Limnocylindrales bacterium]|nr:hypothetical protein [Candidatus Limnocylindrales bacterium]
MVLFGIAEIATSFTHNFFGISTSTAEASIIAGTVIGSFYAIAGFLVLTMKKRAAAVAIGLLVADIAGRLGLVVTGFYPTNTFENILGITVGTIIAALFAIYIGLKWKFFS